MKTPLLRSERPLLRLCLLPLALATLAAGAGAAQQEAKLVASDADAEDTFGSAAATDGERVLVGSPFEGEAADLAGAAYVYRRVGSGWIEEQKLVPASAGLGDKAGSSVAIEGDLAVVGARHRPGAGGAQAGALFVWRRTAGVWVLEATLEASDGSVADELGASVALDGGVIVAGAPLHDGLGIGIDSGAVYVFENVGGVWQETTKLVPADTAEDDEFGRSVDIEGGTLAVGAWGDDDLGLSSGSAYVFEDQGGGVWAERQKLTARNGAIADQFGISIALSETELVVGAWGDEDQGGNAGSAYVFRRNAMGDFVQRQELYASDAAPVDLFGVRVAADGPRIVVGAVGARGAASDAGAAYVFERVGSSFVETDLLSAADGADGDGFGTVAVARNLVVVGAHQDTEQGPNTGAAYVFRLREPLGLTYCTSTPNSSGNPAELTASGSVLRADEDVELFVGSAAAGVPGLLFFGPNAVQVPFGDGFRCVGGQTTRVLPLLVVDPTGNGSRRLNFNAPYAANLVAGSAARFQYWFRDQAAMGAGFNLTDGVELTLQ